MRRAGARIISRGRIYVSLGTNNGHPFPGKERLQEEEPVQYFLHLVQPGLSLGMLYDTTYYMITHITYITHNTYIACTMPCMRMGVCVHACMACMHGHAWAWSVSAQTVQAWADGRMDGAPVIQELAAPRNVGKHWGNMHFLCPGAKAAGRSGHGILRSPENLRNPWGNNYSQHWALRPATKLSEGLQRRVLKSLWNP